MTVRSLNLVSPLAHKATDMRIADTDGSRRDRFGAVSILIGESLLGRDIDSEHITPRILATPGIRTSTTATRTTTTSTTSSAPGPSADQYAAPQPDFTFAELAQAYFDCRQSKRNSASALAFEQNLEHNLGALFNELQRGTYRPGRSICFVITRPKPREVWAADFRDRIVHHLLYNRISPRFYASFIADSCACIPGRGTLYAAQRLEAKIRSITQNWSRPAWYLKLDLANFFVSIDKHVVHDLIAKRVGEPWRRITRRRTFNDALRRVRESKPERLFETANSYFGLLRQADQSHHDRALLANELRRRGHCIKADLTKTYRRKGITA